MALGDDYADPPDLKNRVGIAEDDSTDDLRIIGALGTATNGINKFCYRQFNDAGTVSARVFRPRDRCLVKVDDFSTTTGLIVKSDEDGDGAFEYTWATTDYELEPLNGVVDGVPGYPYWRIRAVNRWFPIGNRSTIQVTARWGWAAIPADVKEACLVAAEEIYKLRDTPFGVGGYGDFGVIRVRDNPFTSRMLQPYRRDPVMAA